MGNPIAGIVEVHHPPPVPVIPIQNERQPILEAEPGKSPVIRIVYGPRTAIAPIPLRLSRANGVSACVRDFRFQLAPRKQKERLTVHLPFPIDRAGYCSITGFRPRLKQFHQVPVDLFVRRYDSLQATHVRTRHNQSRDRDS